MKSQLSPNTFVTLTLPEFIVLFKFTKNQSRVHIIFKFQNTFKSRFQVNNEEKDYPR